MILADKNKATLYNNFKYMLKKFLITIGLIFLITIGLIFFITSCSEWNLKSKVSDIEYDNLAFQCMKEHKTEYVSLTSFLERVVWNCIEKNDITKSRV